MSANNVIIRRVDLTGTFQPLASESTIGRFTVRVAGGANSVFILSDDQVTEVPLERGQSFVLEGVDLADIKAKGALGDYIVVIGSSRTVAQ